MANIGDVVLIYHEEQPAFFARIEDISADPKRDWYQVRLLVLQIPLTETTWKLREEYINGETFTMSGEVIRMEKVRGVEREASQSVSSDKDFGETHGGNNSKVISILDRKRS
jgi:hypothetical protein